MVKDFIQCIMGILNIITSASSTNMNVENVYDSRGYFSMFFKEYPDHA
jgi:hypothetical protein